MSTLYFYVNFDWNETAFKTENLSQQKHVIFLTSNSLSIVLFWLFGDWNFGKSVFFFFAVHGHSCQKLGKNCFDKVGNWRWTDAVLSSWVGQICFWRFGIQKDLFIYYFFYSLEIKEKGTFSNMTNYWNIRKQRCRKISHFLEKFDLSEFCQNFFF